jgi:hypothetical protein
VAYLANPPPGFVLVFPQPEGLEIIVSDEATGVDPKKLPLDFVPAFSPSDGLFVADFDGVTGFESPATLGRLLPVVWKKFRNSFCPDIPGVVFAPSEASVLEGLGERAIFLEPG